MTRRLALVALMLLVVVPAAFAQPPKRGGVLRIAERDAPSLDPHLTISFITHSHINLVYGQLVRFPAGPEQAHSTDFSIVPDVAERWTVSKDGTGQRCLADKAYYVYLPLQPQFIAHQPAVKGFRHHTVTGWDTG
jgi:ABC-type transport system substrate-binding protein